MRLESAFWMLHVAFWLPFAMRVWGDRRSDGAAKAQCDSSKRGPGVYIVAHGFALTSVYGAAVVSRVERIADSPASWSPGFVLGLLCLAVASCLSYWTLRVFRSWKLNVDNLSEHLLETRGPFTMVRHPIYLSFDLMALGSFLCCSSWATLLALVVLFVAGDLRARFEERKLLSHFGEAYAVYCKRVKRSLPGIY